MQKTMENLGVREATGHGIKFRFYGLTFPLQLQDYETEISLNLGNFQCKYSTLLYNNTKMQSRSSLDQLLRVRVQDCISSEISHFKSISGRQRRRSMDCQCHWCGSDAAQNISPCKACRQRFKICGNVTSAMEGLCFKNPCQLAAEAWTIEHYTRFQPANIITVYYLPI